MISKVFSLILIFAPFTLTSAVNAQDEVTIGSTAPIRNWYAGGGLGGSFALNGDATLFVLNEEGGYQLDPILLGGEFDLVLRFGLDLTQQFANLSIFTFGARVTGSLSVWRNADMTLRVAPSVLIGAGVIVFEEVCSVFGCVGGSRGAFDFQFATQAELDLADGLVTVFFRPIAIDGFFFDQSFGRWSVLAGAYVHF